MIKFIQKNLKYDRKKQGEVLVQFVVNKDGNLSELKVIRGVDAELDAEALRVVGMMPPWKPGRQNGKPVAVRFIIPIKFK